jgi:glycosyltransferase involved in cell wall biosynthesis
VAEIDAHLAMENVVTRKSMEGISWRTLGTASGDWLDPSKAAAAAAIRARYAPGSIIAASIGREEKLDSPQFLDAVCELLRRHPKMVFLWMGRVARRSIQSRFEAAGVADRTHFVGWVDTKAYAQAIDLFLDSFPFPCGFTIKEAMAAGKAVVMMRTAESLETGVPGAISPVVEGSGEVSAGDRERLRRAFSDTADFDLYFCARDDAEYVRMASALVESEALRTRAGEANREFIAGFLSSPDDEARKFLDNLDELFEDIPTVN